MFGKPNPSSFTFTFTYCCSPYWQVFTSGDAVDGIAWAVGNYYTINDVSPDTFLYLADPVRALLRGQRGWGEDVVAVVVVVGWWWWW